MSHEFPAQEKVVGKEEEERRVASSPPTVQVAVPGKIGRALIDGPQSTVVARFSYQFACKNPGRRESIELPLAILEEIRSRRSRSSTGTPSQALLCQRCKHAFAYTLEDIQPRLAPNRDLSSVPDAKAARSIKLECDGKGCEFPVLLIAPWLFGLQPGRTWPSEAELATWTIHGNVKCPKGHARKLPLTLKKENLISIL